jgi:hypothetical protein
VAFAPWRGEDERRAYVDAAAAADLLDLALDQVIPNLMTSLIQVPISEGEKT